LKCNWIERPKRLNIFFDDSNYRWYSHEVIQIVCFKNTSSNKMHYLTYLTVIFHKRFSHYQKHFIDNLAFVCLIVKYFFIFLCYLPTRCDFCPMKQHWDVIRSLSSLGDLIDYINYAQCAHRDISIITKQMPMSGQCNNCSNNWWQQSLGGITTANNHNYMAVLGRSQFSWV